MKENEKFEGIPEMDNKRAMNEIINFQIEDIEKIFSHSLAEITTDQSAYYDSVQYEITETLTDMRDICENSLKTEDAMESIINGDNAEMAELIADLFRESQGLIDFRNSIGYELERIARIIYYDFSTKYFERAQTSLAKYVNYTAD